MNEFYQWMGNNKWKAFVVFTLERKKKQKYWGNIRIEETVQLNITCILQRLTLHYANFCFYKLTLKKCIACTLIYNFFKFHFKLNTKPKINEVINYYKWNLN